MLAAPRAAAEQGRVKSITAAPALKSTRALPLHCRTGYAADHLLGHVRRY
jgi:hypothetical protein